MGENKPLGIDIELDAEVAQGHYSNLAIISHSTSEFILDFAAILPGLPKAKVKSRIILMPEHPQPKRTRHPKGCRLPLLSYALSHLHT